MDQNPPKEPRTPINLRIKFRSETLDQFIDRYAIDVSRGGIFIRTREPLAVGTQLKLDFQYQNGTPLMSGEGTVVWIRDPDPNRANVPPGMGVRFDRLSPESQAVLDQLLNDKASREKTGISPIGAEKSGGIAVRRPSSMFAALEPEQAPAQPPSSSAGSSPPGPGAATFPGRPSAAYIPTVSSLGTAGLKPATIVPAAAAPPSQPRMTSSSLPAAGSKTPAPPSQAATAKAPVAGGGAPSAPSSGDTTVVASTPAAPSSAASGAAGYRPLGSARNPFSGSSLQPGRAPASGPGGRAGSPLTGFDEKTAGPFPFDTATPAAGVTVSGGEENDELTDEPTQIAGRMPSFLSPDEDPTSVGSRPGSHPLADAAFLGGDINDEPTRITSREVERPARPVEPELRSLAGGRATGARPGASGTPIPAADRRLASSPGIGITADGGASAGGTRARQSLDLAPPVGSAAPLPPLGDLRSTNQQLETGGPTPASVASAASMASGASEERREGSLDPLAGLDDGAGGPARAADSLPVSGTAPTLLATAAATPKASAQAPSSSTPAIPAPSSAPPAKSAPPVRRPSPALIGLTVVGLGAAAFFVFRYFASQSTQTASTSAIAVAVSPAGSSPEGNAPSAAKGPPEAPPSAAAEAETGPGSSPSRPQGAGSAEAPAAPAAGVASKEKEKKDGVGSKPAAEPGTDNEAARTVAVADSPGAAARKSNKRKVAKVAGATGDVAPPESNEKPTPTESAKTAASDAPAPPEGAAGDESAAGHQIRVTSKPPGAEVAIDGQLVGQTPLSTSIADVSSPHFLSVRKEGFETFEQMISATSAWAKAKGAKGQPAVPTLKINAKLKASGGAAAAAGAAADAKGPAATDGSKAAPAGGEGAPGAAVKEPPATAPPKMEKMEEPKAETKADKTMAPGGADERAPTAP
jgi:uncharacterized protein (TIGR02266 family)